MTKWWKFSYVSQKIGFDMSCKLFPGETICMTCQSLFSGKNKKKYFEVSSAEIIPSMLSVKWKSTTWKIWIFKEGKQSKFRAVSSALKHGESTPLPKRFYGNSPQSKILNLFDGFWTRRFSSDLSVRGLSRVTNSHVGGNAAVSISGSTQQHCVPLIRYEQSPVFGHAEVLIPFKTIEYL